MNNTLIFYVIFLLLFFISFAQCKLKESDEKGNLYLLNIVIITLFFIVIISGMRGKGVGADDYNYIAFIRNTPELFKIKFDEIKGSTMEPGFTLLVSFLKMFSENVNFIFTSITAISVLLISISYYKFSRFYSFCILIYFSHIYLYREMTQIRAGIAYAIVLLGFYFLYNKRNNLFYLLVIISSFFHISTLAAIIIIPFSKVINTRKRAIAIIFLAIVMSLGNVSNILISYASIYLSNSAQIQKYVLDSAGYVYSLDLFNPTTIKQFIFMFIVFIYWNDIVKITNSKIKILISSYVLSLFFLIAFSSLAVFASRIASIFSMIEPILIVQILLSQKDTSKRMAMMILFSIIYALILCLNLEIKQVLGPYSNIIFS
ncbi:EpsG family protein [Budviciaceae bacterium BWR-B9]|uniref:EpsG family protein n=1 Tax=Limnobaculum allomyrinae TaxID=2791986 RepID=A0ABS1IVD3_9GAMM|nr:MULTISPECIES: EpsG family protein [Limnobaculum]MBK5145708.1 EpsG family protein [Limnobaculum allomyrinae]MBV7693758.1 EpsG family protein [Limnobaculum sp. M2-1]